MWAIKWFLAVIMILLVLGFALQNSQERVTVTFLSDAVKYEQVQLWLVIYASFALGVLFWLIVSVFQVMQLRGEIRRMQKTNDALNQELDSLRNLPIGEEEAGFEIKD